MARITKLESAQPGATASARKVLTSVTTVTAAPTVPGDGVTLRGTDKLHLNFQVSGAAPAFYIKLWVFNHTSQTWDEYPIPLPAVRTDCRRPFDILGGPVQVYLQVTGVYGTAPQLDAWIDQIVDTP